MAILCSYAIVTTLIAACNIPLVSISQFAVGHTKVICMYGLQVLLGAYGVIDTLNNSCKVNLYLSI